MSLLTITAIDKHSSDTTSRTFSTDNIESFKQSVHEWEKNLSYQRYELITNEFIDDYTQEVQDFLDEIEVTN